METQPDRGVPTQSQSAERALGFLENAESISILAYAVSLPLSLTFSWILLILGSIISFAAVFLRIRLKKEKPAFLLRPPLLIALIIFAGAIFLSGLQGLWNSAFTSMPDALAEAVKEALRSLFSLKSLLPYLWASLVFQRQANLKAAMLVLLFFTSSLAGVWGSIQQIFNIHPGYQYLQGTGFLSHPMAYAGQMQIFSLLALGIFLQGAYIDLCRDCPYRALAGLMRLASTKAVFIAILIANFAGLFFAAERSAWLGGAAGVLAIAFLSSRKILAMAALFLSGLAAAGWFFVPVLKVRLLSLLGGQDVGVTARLKIWSECLHVYFPQSPLFGIGWLKFPHFHIPEAIVPGVSVDLNHAHSNYVQVLTCAGLLGLLSYLFLLLLIFLAALAKHRRAVEDSNRLNAGIAAGIFGLAVSLSISGAFEYNLGTAQVRLAQWFVFGLL